MRHTGPSPMETQNNIRRLYTEIALTARIDILAVDRALKEEAIQWLYSPEQREDRDQIFSHTKLSVHGLRRLVETEASNTTLERIKEVQHGTKDIHH